ncbi:GSU2403 family nucleotidyltransferase fold protein [Hydrogenophaga flava]|uniref:GSU2403 family nucleotidyltransferase fold protein n=1 Tax=Hydrogenophaga flava TaxID=65657 RepID=UPI00082715F3|nr:GSU2403 family nucleotidyltransferase fold protein [Hydrogenophaga flava]
MNYLPLPDEAARQVIDAQTILAELTRVKALARQVEGGMYWKQEGAYEYLIKTGRGNRQQRLGARSPELEATYTAFKARKAETEARLASLKAAATTAQRLNKAVRAGRVPALVVDLLNKLEDSGLAPHFTVVGTHALYAYEAVAGVRIVAGALATQGVDLLWDARQRVRFLADVKRLDKSMLQLLQEVDPTFVRKDLQAETAINAKGFEVDFLRRMQEGDDPHPFKLSDAEDELWPVMAERAKILTEAPRFSHVVIGATGKMAVMHTISPVTFVEFKRWLAERPNREPSKRRRDSLQAQVVQGLMDEGLLLVQ